jgi:hypothetical protein
MDTTRHVHVNEERQRASRKLHATTLFSFFSIITHTHDWIDWNLSLDAGAIYTGGRGNNHSRCKVMRIHVIQRTLHAKLEYHCAPERSQLHNQAWKQHVKSRLVFAPSLIAGAKYSGGIWSNKSSSKVMRQQVSNKTVHSKLNCNGAETKPPMNSDQLTLCTRKRQPITFDWGFFPSREWKAEKGEEHWTRP